MPPLETHEETVTMETTHTMAGLLADAGAARLRATAPLANRTASGYHQTTWISGALVQPATFMVFDRKNRPTRPPSELSP
ncbi:MAG: hypothetical protein ABWZ76_05485 [Acidimicrobiales bacterium]